MCDNYRLERKQTYAFQDKEREKKLGMAKKVVSAIMESESQTRDKIQVFRLELEPGPTDP